MQKGTGERAEGTGEEKRARERGEEGTGEERSLKRAH